MTRKNDRSSSAIDSSPAHALVSRTDIDRDRFMTAEEAIGYGLIDHVMESRAGLAELATATG